MYELKQNLRLVKTEVFGAKGKQCYVQKFCQFTRGGRSYLVVGRKRLSIQIYDIYDNFKCVSDKQLMTNQDAADFFVTIEVIGGEFKGCTGLGYCYFLNIDTLMTSCFNDFSMSFGLHGPVSFLKFLPASEDSLVILGGKDREIAILDVQTHLTVWKSKSSKKIDKIYQPYMQKEPIWIQDVAIIKKTETEVKFIAATRFGKLLFYNTQVSRLPIDEIEISENPIKHLKLIDDMLFIADSFDNVTLFDYENQKIINKFQMRTGAISSMSFLELDTNGSMERRNNERPSNFLTFVTSYSDKCLRLYKVEDGYKTLISGVKLEYGVSPEICVIEDDVDLPERLKQETVQNKRLRSDYGINV